MWGVMSKHFSDDWIGPGPQANFASFTVDNLVEGSDVILRLRERTGRWVLTKDGWVELDDKLRPREMWIKLVTE